MKLLRSITIVFFIAVILIPTVFFNFTPNTISEIDNRKLTENPFSGEPVEDMTETIESYVNDRIGFRDEMIRSYTVLNDKLFSKMVHPTYIYGKEGYVFGSGVTTSGLFSNYHIAFADMVLELQTYCEERGVPFLFVFEPAKPAVLTEYLPSGRNYSRDWVDAFMSELDKRNINYVDNTVTLKNATNEGKVVFNQKYDANHWNALGAYYGTNAMLEALKARLPDTHVNQLSEFNVGQTVMTSLPVSNFPINEAVPTISTTAEYTSLTENYSKEIEVHPSYPTFGYYVNEQRKSEGSPSALVFQGSYMNGFGTTFMINALGEYTYVHDYQNVLNLPYYFNIFKPDCVVFEVAEYTFAEKYFPLSGMQNIDYNRPLTAYEADEKKEETLDRGQLQIEEGTSLTKITWQTDLSADAVWFLTEKEFDMRKVEGGYEVTVQTAEYQKNPNDFKIAAYQDGILTYYN